ncbi:ABC transporter substrate-binding protein [Krasilnikoviella flava]|uniref:ABC-type glycerol-3-phosphate transport system, substrate-binding protein n=1 Tax=Krasilnikoviella flava TaxID=526729 RepID=A0A1T5ICB1_9MICO|nr:sugar ABC transporter substrate-binding protein [Krasilnikoviella flava]SKC36767.1 ABC-type glycerol-3-phosphate transport system, substrate-binding protein [Krasilnikoviella flava]
MPTPVVPGRRPAARRLSRRSFLAVAGISVAGALAACSGAPTGTKHLRLSSWNIPLDLESYQALADEFVAAHPGTSVAVEVTTGQFHQWFITRLAADLAPDIIRITPQQIGRYAANGSLVDLTGAVPADYQDDWSKPFWAIGAKADGLFGVFQHTDNFITYYDKRVIEQIGVDVPQSLDEAWQWDEFLEIAGEAQKITGRYGFGYGWSGPETAYRWMPVVYQNGGAFLGEDGETPSMDTDAAVGALDFGRRWYADGLVSPANMSKSGGGAVGRDLFTTGQTGLLLDNPEAIAALDEARPDEWGTTYMIRNGGEASDLGGNALAVTRSSKHPELAAELVAFLTSRTNVAEFCRRGNWLPARSSLDAADIGYERHEATMQQFIDQAATIPLSMVRAQSGPYFSSLNSVFADYLDLCFLGELTPAECGAQMTEAMRSVTTR